MNQHPPGRSGLPPLRPAGLWFDIALLAAFAALTATLIWWPPLVELDLAVRDWCDRNQPAPAHGIALAFDHLGQARGLVAATALAGGVLAWRRRALGPLMPAILAPVLENLLDGWLKWWTARGAPHYGSAWMFSQPGGMEYPSGHVDNGVVYWGVLAMLLTPYLSPTVLKWIRWLPGPLVLLGTTYIGYHWLTDAIGGYIIGTLILRLLLRLPPWWLLPASYGAPAHPVDTGRTAELFSGTPASRQAPQRRPQPTGHP